MALPPPVPELKPPGSLPGESAREADTRRRQARFAWTLFAAVAAVAIAVLLLLPQLVSEDPPAEPVFEASQPTPEVDEPKIEPADVPANETENPPALQEVAREPTPEAMNESATALPEADEDLDKSAATNALQDFLRLQAQPGLLNAERWATDEWQAAGVLARAGDEHLAREEFEPALDAYRQASRQLQALLDSRDTRLEEALSAGAVALDDNRVVEAIDAFERAIAIDPGNETGVAGLARTRVREQVLALMQQGSKAEAADDPAAAATAYTEALGLDEAYQPAVEGLARANETLADRAFTRALSDALAALEGGDFSAAESALGEAARLRPADPAIETTRQRLVNARRLATLQRLRREGDSHSEKEDWTAARETYQQALKVDPEAAFALAGAARADRRLTLHRQLDHYLADTSRLAADKPLANAKTLLETNTRPPEDEPQLTAKIEQLAEAVRLAEIPVTLSLRSDNLTEITVYHVGRLGAFFEKSLSLRPGRYIVTGSRSGYRDVRKEVTLAPGSDGESLQLACEEPI